MTLQPAQGGQRFAPGRATTPAAVSKYMVRHRTPPSHTWRSFLDNHAKDLVSLDFFTLPTATFKVLFVFIVLRHDRRRIVRFNVTEHPSAEWTAQQMVDAFPWDTAPRYLVRDRDQTYGAYFDSRVDGVVSKNTNELRIGAPGRFGLKVSRLGWPMEARILGHEHAGPALDMVDGRHRWLDPA